MLVYCLLCYKSIVAYFVGTLVDILLAGCFGERVLAHSTITKYHRIGVLNNKIYFSQSREREVQHQGGGKAIFLPRLLLAYRWPPPPCVLI